MSTKSFMIAGLPNNPGYDFAALASLQGSPCDTLPWAAVKNIGARKLFKKFMKN